MEVRWRRGAAARSRAEGSLRSCAEGDVEAQSELVRRLEPIVRRAVRSVLVSRGHAWGDRIEDLVQDVFLALFQDKCRKLRQFEGRNGCSLAGWVSLVAARLAIDRLRSEARRGTLRRDGVRSPEELENLAARGPGPEEVLARIQDLRNIDAALQELSVEDRVLAELHFGRGLKMEQVAPVLGTSVNALYVRKSRLVRRIRRALRSSDAAQCVEKVRAGDRDHE